MLSSSVSKKCSAARIFCGRPGGGITGIASNPGEKAIRKIWFWVMSIVKFLTYSIVYVFQVNRLNIEISRIRDLIESKILCMDQTFLQFSVIYVTLVII